MVLYLIFLIFFVIFPGGWSQKCREPNGFFPHETQCDKYYECQDGVLTEKLCPDGLMFNDRVSRKLQCELPFNIDCSYRPSVQPAQPNKNCPHLWGLYPNFNDCGKFFNCVDGFAHGFQCPEGLAWNDVLARCDWPDEVDSCDSEAILGFSCPPPTEEELAQFREFRYPHPQDCKKFFVCIDVENGEKKPRLLSCEFPLVFSYALNRCDYAENVTGCENYYGDFKLDARNGQKAGPPRNVGRNTEPARNTGRNTGSSRNTGQYSGFSRGRGYSRDVERKPGGR